MSALNFGNDVAAARTVTTQEIAQIVAYARVLRAEEIAGLTRGLVRRLAASVKQTFAALRHWQQREAAVHDLMALDDRTLHDIGLSRGEIRAAVCGTAARRTGVANENGNAAANSNKPRTAA